MPRDHIGGSGCSRTRTDDGRAPRALGRVARGRGTRVTPEVVVGALQSHSGAGRCG